MSRWSIAAATKRPAPTARASSSSGLGADFNAFLFATVCNERNEMPLSVVSALARLDLDPWAEAAALARMPADGATRRLSSSLARVVNDAQVGAAVAARLVALLPRPASGNAAARGHPVAQLNATHRAIAGIVWLLFLTSVVASLMASHLAPRHSAPQPVATATFRN